MLSLPRIAQIRLNNVVNCLRRHDWVYRWNNLIKILGMEPTTRAFEREDRLRNFADSLALVNERPRTLRRLSSDPPVSISCRSSISENNMKLRPEQQAIRNNFLPHV